MKRFLSIIIILIFASNVDAQGSCSLTTFSYQVKHDGDVFYLIISQPIDIHNNYFVFVNDEMLENDGGEFGPFKANCETAYSLILINKTDETCNVKANIGTICNNNDTCEIGEIEYSISGCNPNGVASIKLDFKYANVSDSFKVRGNDKNYGTFAYTNLPITISPLFPDCQKEYTFVVMDATDENCKQVVEDLRICCNDDCTPPLFEIVSQECDSNDLFLKLKLVEQLPPNAFEININGSIVNSFEVDYPYVYVTSELPANTYSNNITVCTNGYSENCCHTLDFSTEDCSTTGDCFMGNITYFKLGCENELESYILLDFDYQKPASDSFEVMSDGKNYGTFAYADLPIRIGPFISDCESEYKLGISDSKNPNCGNSREGLTICCNQSCLEPIFEIIETECYDYNFGLKLKVIHPLVSNTLQVILNGEISNSYQIDFPYLYIKGAPDSSGINELTLCSLQASGETCCYSQKFQLDCSTNGACEIGDIKVEPIDCNDANLPGFYINFDYKNVGNEGFSLKGNGIDYGDFKYENLPIFVNIQDNCEINYEFVVIDNEVECYNFIEYGFYCCSDNCSFTLDDTRVKCNDGLVTEVAFYLFEATDPIKEYSVYLNNEFIGETSKNNTFLEFPVQVNLETIEQLELTVCDNECCVTKNLDISDCFIPPVECEISNVRTSQVICGEQGLTFKLDFDHKGTGSNEFEVFSIFGKVGTFKYSDLPITVKNFPAVNLGLNVLFICDKGSFCCQAHLFSSPFCFSTNGGISYVDDVPVASSNRYIRQNPSNYNLILDSPFENTVYQIIDGSGKLVKTIKADQLETEVDVSDLHSGLYMVRIENKEEIKIEKLIITN